MILYSHEGLSPTRAPQWWSNGPLGPDDSLWPVLGTVGCLAAPWASRCWSPAAPLSLHYENQERLQALPAVPWQVCVGGGGHKIALPSWELLLQSTEQGKPVTTATCNDVKESHNLTSKGRTQTPKSTTTGCLHVQSSNTGAPHLRCQKSGWRLPLRREEGGTSNDLVWIVVVIT